MYIQGKINVVFREKIMFQVIKKDIVQYAEEYLGQGLIFALFGLLVVSIAVCVGGKIKGLQKVEQKGKLVYKGVLWYFFFVYIYMVLAITFFSRNVSPTATLDLKLFHTFLNKQWAKIFIYENVLMFVPLGIFAYLLFEVFRKVYITVLLGFSCSLSIEIAQYITRRGKFQVDDIFNNVAGMLIGYGIVFCLEKLFKLSGENITFFTKKSNF